MMTTTGIAKISAMITECDDWWHVVWADADGVAHTHDAETAVAASRHLTDWAAEQAVAGTSTIISITWHTRTRAGKMVVNSIV